MMQLTAKAGPAEGASWKIGGNPLLLGRATTCDVTIADPTVSRKHCEIKAEGNGIVLRDLDSSNTTLVNGAPVKERVLLVGDEIAIGSAIFLVTRCNPEAARLTPNPIPPPQTLSLAESESIYLSAHAAKSQIEGRPQTVRDLALLFEIGRELSRASSLQELFDTLILRLKDRFSPTALWIARCYEDDDELVFHPQAETEHKPPTKILRKALSEQCGMLTPGSDHKVMVTTLVAPMSIGGERLGVLALESRSPQGAYGEADLEFLVALAHTIAPFIHAVERIEQLRRDNQRLQTHAGDSVSVVGESKAIRKVRSMVRKAASSDLSVLILGETGVGKELVARMVHDFSRRASGPMTIVNCAAIPHELFESELFGYEVGAFTGASHRKQGLIELANGGTLFLDEVGDLSRENQARILRAVETGAFRRVGAQKETQVDIRVVSATNKDMPRAVASGEFRSDLLHRLNGFEIHVPPLRERTQDIPLLVEHFLRLGRDHAKHPITGFEPDALAHLCALPWRGNVRELRSVVNRAIVLAAHDKIQVSDLTSGGNSVSEGQPLRSFSLSVVEKNHITAVLRECGGNISNAARLLEVSRNTLYNKIAEYGIEVS
ncbi:MAG: sigma 54-interacting transcriptional regulator [Candidatus Hydrogenedentes bacterium]|nr:sigma 54-interacting transcriptional regulator [Candidatus Hydrogenedentota bacterium]